ncbi:MAG: indole-3-glycerol phosphate synthase TrpC [Clostridiales bacterium]|jgi:indole-3-glycerol phosphate synthase|nr:indole-3-glycerol phosphate synthase TrpC [Clostridiales bacterium]
MAADILEKLAAAAARRVERDRAALPEREAAALCAALPGMGMAFEKALRAPGMSLVCELKRASPSKGVIAESYPYMEIARDYEEAGAACLSVLTEPEHFLGDDRHLAEIARRAGIPVLRKDFTVSAYQIYQARLLGAGAVLLICALLDGARLKEYIGLADLLGMAALVEAHDERELDMALGAGARVVGVNNRNLRTFEVDFENSLRMRRLVPPGALFVAESGIRGREDALKLERAGADAALVGEALMRAPDRRAALRALAGA